MAVIFEITYVELKAHLTTRAALYRVGETGIVRDGAVKPDPTAELRFEAFARYLKSELVPLSLTLEEFLAFELDKVRYTNGR